MNIQKYVRKPFEVEGLQVTADNAHEIAEWCGGSIEQEGENDYIKVPVNRVLNERQTKAFIGDWVLKGNGFKVYTDKAFRKSFQLLDAGEPAQELLTTAYPA